MIRAALLDMNNGVPNQGAGMIRAIFNRYSEYIEYESFDVRHEGAIPDLSYNIYVCSGGPGHPINDGGPWWDGFFNLIEGIWKHNQQTWNEKIHVFFICHSFQLACHHFGLGSIETREKMSFGTYPIYKTAAGKQDAFLKNLPEPFYIADFRKYGVIRPDKDRLYQLGAEVLAYETLKSGEKKDRAMMAIRFSPEIFGTQFHPEANPEGMVYYFKQEERKLQVIDAHGESRYKQMMRDLNDEKKLKSTFDSLLPRFLENAIQKLEMLAVPT